MYITYSPAEKRRVLFFHCAEEENQRRPERALAREDRPMPARDVAPGECWAFTDHRTMAQVMAEGAH
jgi:hypothetical protein